MKIFNLLTFVAVLISAPLATSSVSAATTLDNAQACHFQPVADSPASLQHSQSVGVLYSENTVSNLEYLTNYHAVDQRSARNPALDSRIRDAFINLSLIHK